MTVLERIAFQALKDFLKQISSKATAESVWPKIKNQPLYKKYARRWDELSPVKKRKVWGKLADIITKEAYATRPYCIRCGECCRQGSPTFYKEDLPLLVSGRLLKNHLFTIRPGELAYSSEREQLITVKQEMVKLKEVNGRQCLFFDEALKRCRIYEFRPLQCRVMACWQPERFLVLKKKRPLKRQDVIKSDSPLWPLIIEHQRQCDVFKLRQLLNRCDEKAKEQIREMAYYDLQLRHLLQEKFQVDSSELDFYLGRPISSLIRLYRYAGINP